MIYVAFIKDLKERKPMTDSAQQYDSQHTTPDRDDKPSYDSVLDQDDLNTVAGGIGPIYDIYKVLDEAWPDIKKGFLDALND